MAGYPRASLILEAGYEISKMLRAVTEKLVVGLSPSSGTRDRFGSMASMAIQPSVFVESGSRYLGRPFASPPSCAIEDLLSIASDRVEYTFGHVTLLQTDPAFLRWYTQELLDNALLSAECKSMPEVCYGLAAEHISRDVANFWVWKGIVGELNYLKSVDNSKHNDPRLLSAMGALESLILHHIDHLERHICSCILQRPAFKDLWDIKYPAFGVAKTSNKGFKSALDLFKKDPLHWCLTQILTSTKTKDGFDHAMLFAFLNNLLSSKTIKEESKGRIDDALLEKYSDLGALHELRDLLLMHRTGLTYRNFDDAKLKETGRAWRYLSKGYKEGSTVL
ncbi:uncharacterized protein LY89DRAFT_2307 [Mollisia scopiformis]|uniref:Uncharacterized protein n=1 Tax=Mollisia scopiformis TaxID=149040 RepID=A0A194XUF2_MOLSC|nr:uncharacterized protein LY89DRAFT_2307 [Mollisia scopiformis]KUJ23766.1 hypothetical protein LY89DRAFT_2307 [Mollisia scopiformis]